MSKSSSKDFWRAQATVWKVVGSLLAAALLTWLFVKANALAEPWKSFWTGVISNIIPTILLFWFAYIFLKSEQSQEKKEQEDKLADDVSEKVYKKLRDDISFKIGKALSHEHPTYKWLAEGFRYGRCTAQSNPLQAIKAMLSENCQISEPPSKQTSVHYQISQTDGQAADYLCVISAHKDTKFLLDNEFSDQVDYYREWDCRANPHDHVRRVFSVPAEFDRNKLPKWPADFTPEARQRLFLLLWLNSSFGVSATLHLFTPSDKPDFFEAADYVHCHDPTNVDRGGDMLWIAKPGNEINCLEITRAPLLAAFFHYEFYKRVGGGHHKHHENDVMYNVLRYNRDHLLTHLGLNKNMAPEMGKLLIGSIEELMKGKTTWTEPDKVRIANRWDRWFPEERKSVT